MLEDCCSLGLGRQPWNIGPQAQSCCRSDWRHIQVHESAERSCRRTSSDDSNIYSPESSI